MGNGGAKLLGLEKAEIPVSESISGMVKVVSPGTCLFIGFRTNRVPNRSTVLPERKRQVNFSLMMEVLKFGRSAFLEAIPHPAKAGDRE